MNILGFTGTRTLTPETKTRVRVSLLMLGADEYVTGGAVGVDAFVGATLAKLYPLARHRVIVPANRSQVDAWWRRSTPPLHLDVQLMPDGTSYRDRNQSIVDRATELMAFPMYPEHDERSRRSGTWQTVRLARAAEIPISVVILCGLQNERSQQFRHRP